MEKRLTLPLTDQDILDLQVGDAALLSGIIVTARDRAHQWLMDSFIRPITIPDQAELAALQDLKSYLDNGVIYHCGPIVRNCPDGSYQVSAAGPTTSLRQELYTPEVIHFYHLKGIIGKGGMGECTLQACQDRPAAYFHAFGGAASLLATCVQRVLGVYQLEFGMPEALWVLEVKEFPVVVTMDAHGNDLHANIKAKSAAALQKLINSRK